MSIDEALANPKAHALELIGRLPDDVTWEQIEYHVWFCGKVAVALHEEKSETGIPHEEVGRRLGLIPS